MKWMTCLAFLVGCQHGDGDSSSQKKQAQAEPAAVAPVTDEYRADVATICDVVHLSGADTGPHDERWTTTAMWLPSHLKSESAHEFLVSIQPLAYEARARALETEAQRVGLSGCALAAELRNP